MTPREQLAAGMERAREREEARQRDAAASAVGMSTARGMVAWLCERLDLDPYPADASEAECVAWLGHAFVLEYCESSGRDCAFEAANILQVHLDTLTARREASR